MTTKAERITERPILMHARSVRGILEGRKTQTRRIIKQAPIAVGIGWSLWYDAKMDAQLNAEQFAKLRCPYGRPGERLWVRETWATGWNEGNHGGPFKEYPVVYRADELAHDIDYRWKPPIHMRRADCRLVLEITNVRIERVQDISANDALAEGVSGSDLWTPKELDARPFEEKWWDDFHFWTHYPQMVFGRLWDQINGAGAWERNDWVWVVEFRKLEAA